jgi:hypothetical protein
VISPTGKIIRTGFRPLLSGTSIAVLKSYVGHFRIVVRTIAAIKLSRVACPGASRLNEYEIRIMHGHRHYRNSHGFA